MLFSNVRPFCFDNGGYAYAGSLGGGVYRSTARTTAVRDCQDGVAAQWGLEQNYPNPFNPKTVISGQLPVASHLKLVVYDLLGREVTVLLDEYKAPGTYRVAFDGAGLASGVYICRMTAGNYVGCMKMALIK